MLGLFSLRLACGLVGCLLLLPPDQVNPRYFRTQFLVTLSLTALAAVTWSCGADVWLWMALAAGLGSALLGALSWSLERAPAGRIIAAATLAVLVVALTLANREQPAGGTHFLPPGAEGSGWGGTPPLGNSGGTALGIADQLTGAALLGAAVSAMLLGHFYLIAPGMPIGPLLRLLMILFSALALRAAVAGISLLCFTAAHSLGTLNDVTALWLPVRWVVGLLGPLVLGWMAREAAKIRSTQSATGILYVIVIFCFLGELTSLLLRHSGLLL